MGGIRFDHISQVVSGKIFKLFPILLPYLPLTHVLLNLIPDLTNVIKELIMNFQIFKWPWQLKLLPWIFSPDKLKHVIYLVTEQICGIINGSIVSDVRLASYAGCLVFSKEESWSGLMFLFLIVLQWRSCITTKISKPCLIIKVTAPVLILKSM